MKTAHHRFAVSILALLVLPTPAWGADPIKAGVADTRDEQTAPGQARAELEAANKIIQRNCVECHGPKKQKGRFRIDHFALGNILDAQVNHLFDGSGLHVDRRDGVLEPLAPGAEHRLAIRNAHAVHHSIPGRVNVCQHPVVASPDVFKEDRREFPLLLQASDNGRDLEPGVHRALDPQDLTRVALFHVLDEGSQILHV